MTISYNLKIKIIADYLFGMKREDIAKKYGISTGSVSAIAEEFKEEIPDIDKIRAMMIKLDATGNSPKIFYHAIRLYNHIKDQGLTEVQVENILEILQDYAFKNNCNISDLFDAIMNAYVIAQKCGTDLEHIEEYANAKATVVESKEALIRKLNNDIEVLPHKLNIDLTEFQEYQRNKSILQKLIMESEIKDRSNKLLEEQNAHLRIQLQQRDGEIERLNSFLSQKSKKENGYYTDYHQGSEDFQSTYQFVDDSIDVEGNNDSH